MRVCACIYERASLRLMYMYGIHARTHMYTHTTHDMNGVLNIHWIVGWLGLVFVGAPIQTEHTKLHGLSYH